MTLSLMDPKLLLMALATVVIVTVAVIVVLYMGKRRNSTAVLRKKFGPEYDRAVREQGSERKAETKLADRERRVEKLSIRDLDPVEYERFSKQWSPTLDDLRGLGQVCEPVHVQAFGPQRTVERFHISVVGWLPGSREVDPHLVADSSQHPNREYSSTQPTAD